MLSQSLASILRELEEALTRLPPDAEERAARFVTAHGRVFVAGMGRSGLMLRAFAIRLAQMGLTVYVAGETVTPAVATTPRRRRRPGRTCSSSPPSPPRP